MCSAALQTFAKNTQPSVIAKYNIQPGDTIYVEGIRKAVESGAEAIEAVLGQNGKQSSITLKLENLSAEEREIILKGCLINYYA